MTAVYDYKPGLWAAVRDMVRQNHIREATQRDRRISKRALKKFVGDDFV
jgi:hypothetical protein